MTATTWAKTAPTATTFSNSRFIPNIGATMNTASYTMNDAILTMNDEKNNPIDAAPTTWTKT